MSGTNDPFTETLSRILSAHKGAVGGQWPTPLWRDIHDAGFPLALVAEAAGGAALSWEQAWPLLALIGEAAAPAPLAESMMAQWLLGASGLAPAAGVAVIAAPREPLALTTGGDGVYTVSGTLPRVPWGRHADALVTIAALDGRAHTVLISVSPAVRGPGVTLSTSESIAGEPRDTFVLTAVPVVSHAPAPLSSVDLLSLAAAVRSAQIGGALRAALSLAVAHATLRVQFGRPLAAFQAIQQQLARFGTQTAAAVAASQAALEAVDACLGYGDAKYDRLANSINVCTGKVRAGEAAGIGAAIAHQVFGAMGFTQEHELHHVTRRLWAWRDEFGNESFWSRRIGEAIIAAGPQEVWRLITAPDGKPPLHVSLERKGS